MPDGQGFIQATQGPGLFSGGEYLRRNAFDLSGIPGFEGQTGMVAGMMLQQLLPSILGPNYIASPFNPQNQNLQMHRQTMDFFAQRQQSMSLAAKQDQETYFRMIHGLSNLAGVEFNAPQQQAARRMAEQMGSITPMLAELFPEALDVATPGGSAAVMARGLHEGGRLAFDPDTGRLGLSGAASGRIAAEVSEQLYGDGEGMTRMKGLRRGQSGMMFDEMMRRGLGPASGMGASFDSKAVSKSLQDMSGAVKAVQEIFGDMGHPDAPMSQVFNALQQLTQGGAGRFSPEKLEQSVRETYTVAKATRLGIDAMMGLMGELGQSADRLGLDRSLVPEAAKRAALSGQAYGASGAEAAGGFGRLSKEEFTALSGELGVQAADSQQARQLGAVMALADQGQLKKGSRAEELAEAIRNRRNTLKDGTSVFMSPEQLTALMKESGVSQAVFSELMLSETGQQEYVQKHEIGSLVRGNQGKLDVDPTLRGVYQNVAFETLTRQGMGAKQAGSLAEQIGAASVKALRTMSEKELGDPTARNAAMVKALRADPALKDALQGMDDQTLSQIGVLGWDRGSALQKREPRWRAFKGLLGLLNETDDDRIGAQVEKTRHEIRGIVAVQSAVAGLGQQPLLQRITNAIKDADGTTDLQDIVAQGLGGIKKGPATELLANKLKELSELNDKLDDATQRDNKKEIEEYKEQAKKIVGDINKIADDAVVDDKNRPDKPQGTPVQNAVGGVAGGLGIPATPPGPPGAPGAPVIAPPGGGAPPGLPVPPGPPPGQPGGPGTTATADAGGKGVSDALAQASKSAQGVVEGLSSASQAVAKMMGGGSSDVASAQGAAGGTYTPPPSAPSPGPRLTDEEINKDGTKTADKLNIKGRLRIEWGGTEGELIDATGDPRNPGAVV